MRLPTTDDVLKEPSYLKKVLLMAGIFIVGWRMIPNVWKAHLVPGGQQLFSAIKKLTLGVIALLLVVLSPFLFFLAPLFVWTTEKEAKSLAEARKKAIEGLTSGRNRLRRTRPATNPSSHDKP